jgi:hypothetical protein
MYTVERNIFAKEITRPNYVSKLIHVKSIKVVALSFLFVLSYAVLIPNSAQAGGGCGVSIPTTSSTFIKPGQSFYIDFSFIQFDSDINYADPKIAPEVNFSSSVAYLQQRMLFLGLDSNNWAKYRATFQIPSGFVGNQNLQAVLIYPSCEGATREITYGPQITIASDSSIPTCIIEDLQVDDYSVEIGKPFKIAFKVISPLTDLVPIIELTDSVSKRIIQARLAGKSGNDLKIYEATISYTQAFQYNYGAIARAVVNGMCNASGQRQVIGVYGYVTSMAMLDPIYPDFPCEAKDTSIMTKTRQLMDEELFCNSNPDRGNTLTWMKIQSVEKTTALEPCARLFSTRMKQGSKAYCIYKKGSLAWVAEKDIKLPEWQEANKAQLAKIDSLYTLIVKAKNSNPDKVKQLDSLWQKHNVSNSLIPESTMTTFEELIFINGQTEKFLTELSTLVNSKTETSVVKPKPISVTCIKGKLTKKVTAVSPKCPAGYKKK